MKTKQFEIWLADLNPQIGTEAGKVRPVLVVQTNLLNSIHPSTLVCPITSQTQPEAKILRVHLKKHSFGIQLDSDILIDQVRAIDNSQFIKKLGVLDIKTARLVQQNLKIVLDLDGL
jgi:mRNA interferase MazF